MECTISEHTEDRTVWVFNGPQRFPGFPSAVFTSRYVSEHWIQQYELNGLLTEYPLDTSAYDWAIAHGTFKPRKPEHYTTEHIERFTNAGLEHIHYEDGRAHSHDSVVLGDHHTSPTMQNEETYVCVFFGSRSLPQLPGAVFTDISLGEQWLARDHLTGTFIRYPLDIGVYDWATTHSYFTPIHPEHTTASFIENFSSSHQTRYYYADGVLVTG